MDIDTFVDELGEHRYRITLTRLQWIDLRLLLLLYDEHPNERAIRAVESGLDTTTADDDMVTVTFASMEALAMSRVLEAGQP